MAFDKKEMIGELKFEIEMIEKGGYYPSVREPRHAPEIFRDSVTCLNGHVHQLFTKTEGNVTFHSATTTAYPLPAPGAAPAPTPQTLPAGKLGSALGIREVSHVSGRQSLALRDRTLT